MYSFNWGPYYSTGVHIIQVLHAAIDDASRVCGLDSDLRHIDIQHADAAWNDSPTQL